MLRHMWRTPHGIRPPTSCRGATYCSTSRYSIVRAGCLRRQTRGPQLCVRPPSLDGSPQLWHARPMDESYVMKLSCRNRPGIVAGVSDFLFRHDYNILESRQFDDTIGGSFFMRVVFNAVEGGRPGDLHGEFVDVAQRFGRSEEHTSELQSRQ